MSDKKSWVAIVPNGDVKQLMSQFLGSCSNETKEAGGGKMKHTRAEGGKKEWRAGAGPRSTRGRGGRGRNQKRGGGDANEGRRRHQPQPLSHDLLPQWNGHQLIGDSLMVRLGTYASRANIRPTFNKELHANQLGLCIGGQTCSQLLRMLKHKDCPKIGPSVILMIGTNNILKRVPSDATEAAFKQVVEELLKLTEHLTILTVPPIPLLAGNETSQEEYEKLNDTIRNLPTRDGLQVNDISHIFYNNDALKTIKSELFEKDLIHWNRAAMEMLLLEMLD